ncbi:glycosyltransferase [Candidatus Protofrankia californiensis]|uniref:glycosyltransferase n=1 Tax=Candidatus Protofrankia californiensis TaxID=1839754 RepID=UPI0010416E6E|nr:glycosyltransferase [Candidatus Protofrankia californiensis]
MTVLASVVVPAHNEEAVIGRCLERLADGVRPGDLDIVVVCNGCTDRTAQLARAAGARVVETPRPGKAGALNLGDETTTGFPRFYVDADIEVRGSDLLRVAEVLREDRALAAAPRIRIATAGVSRAVRDYYRIWLKLPYARDNHVGSGVVGVSEQGRARFDRFPEAIADDFFLYQRFAAGERRTVDEAEFIVRPARTARDLVLRKIRVYAGNIQMRQLALAPAAATPVRARRLPDWLAVVWAEPALVTAVPAYVAISGAAQLLARRKVRRGQLGTWERDASSRVTGTAA